MDTNKFYLMTDMDDVLENLLESWLDVLTFLQRHNPDFVPKTIDDLHCWDIHCMFPMLTIDEVFEPLNTDLIWNQIRPLPGAVEAMRYFNEKDNVEVRIVTSSHYTAVHPKRKFLKQYFPFIEWGQMIICKEKQLVHGDVLVDDYENNLLGGDYRGILMDMTKNQHFDAEAHGIIRVKNWDEAIPVIDKMIAEKFSK